LSDTASCSKDGTVTYEDTLAEAFSTDILPALHDTVGILDTTTIKTCTAADPKSHACTTTKDVDGIQVLAAATRALVDPAYAKAQGLKDRFGKTTALRNDGTTNPQVTAIYLLTNALNGMDKAFTDYASTHPDDADRQTQWRAARSQLVDQFLAAEGGGAT